MAGGDYVDLTIPTKLGPEQRTRMVASFQRNLGILNGPASKEAKAAARKAIKALRDQFVLAGGKVQTSSSNYQTDPDTGEITGIIGKEPIEPAKPRSILTADSHQIRIPLGITKASAAPTSVSTAIPSSLSLPKEPVRRAAQQTPDEDALNQKAIVDQNLAQLKKGGLEGSAGYQALQADATRLQAQIAKTTPSRRLSGGQPITSANMQAAASQPVPESVSSVIPDLNAAPAPSTTAEPVTPVTQEPAAPKPTVPGDMEDLNADPTLAALAPPPAAAAPPTPAGPAKTPEMLRLEQLLAQPEPAPPNFELSTIQKIAAGALSALRGAEKVEPLIAGQRATAAQKYVLARQTREETINNLIKLVGLQNEQAQQQAVAGQNQADRVAKAEGFATTLQGLHEMAAPALGGAYSQVQALSDPKLTPDPAMRSRAEVIINKMASVKKLQETLDAGFKLNPFSVDQNQVELYKSSVADLYKSVDDSIQEMVKQKEQNKPPAIIQRDINDLNAISSSAQEILNKMDSMTGVIGPFDARFLKPLYTWFSDANAQDIGKFETVVAAAQGLITAFAGRTQSTTEQEIYAGFKLPLTLPQGQFRGRVQGILKYSQAKTRALQGQPGAANEAVKAAAEGQGWTPVGLTGDGYPIWVSPQGDEFVEAPESVVH